MSSPAATMSLVPFLYHTSTLAGIRGGRPIRLAQITRGYGFRPRSQGQPVWEKSKGVEIPFEHDNRTPKPPPPTAQEKATGTLTADEQRTFEDIFAEIARREIRPYIDSRDQQQEADEALNQHSETAEGEEYDIKFENDSQPSIRTKASKEANDMTGALRAILDHASEKTHDFERLSPLQQLQAPSTDRGKLVMKYPQPLRISAHNAFHFLDRDPIGLRPSGSYDAKSVAAEMERTTVLKRTVRLEQQRRQLYSEMEQTMNSARSDMHLWDIMEKEVFAMVDKMKLGDHHFHQISQSEAGERFENDGVETATATATDEMSIAPSGGKEKSRKGNRKENKKAKKKKQEEASAVEDISEVLVQEGPRAGALSVRVHGPLYPAYLLMGLRMLDSKFARPSPLTSSVLPRIKELGLASFVLGVSTPFYNELMRIQWGRYGDVNAVLNLLEEMRVSGLFTDEATLQILSNIRRTMQNFAHRTTKASGAIEGQMTFVRHMMLLPEYDTFVRKRIGYWVASIHESIEERRETLGF